MTEETTPPPAEILRLKDQIWRNWEQLPPEHQATVTMVMVQTVMNGAYGEWMLDAWQLLFGENQPNEHTRNSSPA